MRTIRELAVWTLVCGALALAGCGDDNDGGPTQPQVLDEEAIEAVLASGPRDPVPETTMNETSTDAAYGDPEGISPPDDYVYVCTETHYDIWSAPQTYPIFDPNAEWLYPGCLLKGATIHEPTPELFPVHRGPGTICINNISGAEISCQTFDVTNMSNAIIAANAIIGSQPEEFPAVTGLHHVHFESEDQLRVSLNANASFFGLFKSSANFTMDASSHREYFVVELSQRYYTLMFQPPESVGDFFGGDVTVEEVAPYLSQGNPPAWVSSITYGRMCYFIISSTESREDVETSVDASFVFGGGSTNVKHVSELEGLEVHALFLGGTASEAIQAVRGGISSLDAFLAAFANPSIGTALPLSYQLRDVYHDYPVIKNGFAAQYTLRDCILTDAPGFVAQRDFYVEGGDAYQEIQAPRINHPNTVSFVSGLSYRSGGGSDHDDDYAFKIDPVGSNGNEIYCIQTASNGGADPLSATYGRIVTWALPDYVHVDQRQILEIDGDETAELYLPGNAGERMMTIVEPLWYWTDGNDKLQFYCSTPSSQFPYVRIWSSSENPNHGERIKFRVTTLVWPDDKPLISSERSMQVAGNGFNSMAINERRVIVSPVVYQVNGAHEYEWDFTLSDHSVTLRTDRGRDGAVTQAKVFELKLY